MIQDNEPNIGQAHGLICFKVKVAIVETQLELVSGQCGVNEEAEDRYPQVLFQC
jgi:hypothetical protein